MNKSTIYIVLLAALFFLPLLGGVHLFDWDEINFAEVSREMLSTGDFLRVYIDFQPFWEKPPLFFWLQAGAMSIFGVNEYAARFPNAICGILTLVFLFKIGIKLYDKRFAWIWVMAYVGSILPHLYFKSGIIDPWFNLFIFSSLYFFIQFYWKKESFEKVRLNAPKWRYLVISSLLMGCAILTKGPVAFLIVVLVFGVYWVIQRCRWYVSLPQFILYGLMAFGVTTLWFGLEILQNGTWFIEEFITYQIRLFSTHDAGHKGFLGYHFVVLLLGCFPASIFALPSFFSQDHDFRFEFDFKRWMLVLFWVVLILFSLVQSKIVHYSSLCYFPLTYLAALHIYKTIQNKSNFSNWLTYSILTIGVLLSLVVILVPFAGQNPDLLKPLFAKDPFAMANLEADVHWTGWESLVGIFLLIVTSLSFYFFKKEQHLKGIRLLFFGTAIFLNVLLIVFVNRIEAYSQRAAIEFYKNLEGEDVYVHPIGYKSYAHLFYTKKTAENSKSNQGQNWLLQGDIDKPVYFITKINRVGDLKNYPELKKIGEKNGFVFFKRDKSSMGQ